MSDVWHEYLEIMSDPAHILVEISFIIMVDLLLLGMAWPFFKRARDKWHERHDKEHHGG